MSDKEEAAKIPKTPAEVAAEKLEAIAKRRAERRAAAEGEKLVQEAIDMAALDEIEEEHGDGGVAFLRLARFVPGLPTMIIVRAADNAENKRFQSRIQHSRAQLAKGKKKDPAADQKAAEEVADLVVLYPAINSEDYAQIRDLFHTAHAKAGVAALDLCTARAEDEGNE